MTALEKFVEFAQEAKKVSRRALLLTLCLLLPLLFFINYLRATSEQRSYEATMICLGMILIALLISVHLIYRGNRNSLGAIRCPECGTHLGRRFSFKGKLDLDRLIADPENYRYCRQCGVDFSDLEWKRA
jgi:hypothetical protein